jgi:cytochrome c-type biogenesis protein CcmH
MRALRRLVPLLAVLAVLAAEPISSATDPGEILADPSLEARARALSKELRCLVCQNQSIDDSDAELARDLRRIVREQLAGGKSDDEIIAFLTARYGDFVLLKPPVRPATLGLWFGPFLILVIAGIGIAVWLRRRRGSGGVEAEALSAEDQRRLEALLGPPQSGRGTGR